MYQVKYIETLGTGLTDMLEECKLKGLKTPLLEEISGRFRVVIWRPVHVINRGDNRGDNLPSEQLRIYEMIVENPKIRYVNWLRYWIFERGLLRNSWRR